MVERKKFSSSWVHCKDKGIIFCLNHLQSFSQMWFEWFFSSSFIFILFFCVQRLLSNSMPESTWHSRYWSSQNIYVKWVRFQIIEGTCLVWCKNSTGSKSTSKYQFTRLERERNQSFCNPSVLHNLWLKWAEKSSVICWTLSCLCGSL